ncbi:hypothetical protein [Methylobacterium indicum]|uniref:Uncharacterized protein n=1 Tax=Methylobacterium indicum TaxID=1775910 RepID=A0A8H8X155_9HYPH|nr:hypothetical protein [Methylobacterium indicum]BCM87789.1 hypothetical protein mvi_62500 [Methylobacterium indicum]
MGIHPGDQNGPRPPKRELHITAYFVPQAWVNDYAVEVDPEGETEFDVAPELRAMGRKNAMNLDREHQLRDDLRYAAAAPQWVKDWSGPFEVLLRNPDEVEALFED